MNPTAVIGGTIFALCLSLLTPGAAVVYNAAPAIQLPGPASSRTPSAHAGTDLVVKAGDVVQFHGHGASPDQLIVEYTWDFESDGVPDFISPRSGEAVHVFTRDGDYVCVLKVRDSKGQTAQSSCRVKVVPSNPDLVQTSKASGPALDRRVNPPDGTTRRYAILFNGGAEQRYWVDMTLCYSMLTSKYAFSPSDIYLLNYDGTANGANPEGMIDYPATLANLQTVVSNLATIADLDDEVFFCITDHGRGYSGSLAAEPNVFGYLDGRASVDPGDEPDFLECNFKLRSLMTGGANMSNHGMNVWKVYDAWLGSRNGFYRHKFVSHFANLYIASLGMAVSDDDVYIERLLDYPRGDLNQDGYIDASLGEVLDYDGDGVPPYDSSTGQFDEDDWGPIDELQDYDYVNTQVPEGGLPYKLFDKDFQGKLCIDLGYTGGELHVDGRDEDGLGWFDWMDVNQDGDTNDVISIDEAICAFNGHIYDDDLREALNHLSVGKLTIVAEPCFSGGLIEDLSSSGRVICTASTEDAVSWGDYFIRAFIAALHGQDENAIPVSADTDASGSVSMLEAFNYAVAHDWAAETPQYDDNGDGISHAGPVPSAGDGFLGANTFLSGAGTPNSTNEWISSSSGSWENPCWSLGQLPARGQDLVALRNAGWKAVAIGRDTVLNHPSSVALDNLTISAPVESFNMLLMNFAGLDVPLIVDGELSVSTNASILSHYSAMSGGTLRINSTATFLDGSQCAFTNVVVGDVACGRLNITNSVLSAETVISGSLGEISQSGGSVAATELRLLSSGTLAVSGGARLAAPLIEIGPAAVLAVNGGTISNTTSIVMRSGVLRAAGSQRFGKLQVLEDTNAPPGGTGATLYLEAFGDPSGPRAALEFVDSSDTLWSGPGLSIVGWTAEKDGLPGDKVLVGTTSHGLNASQLSKVTFVNPTGWPAGHYLAQILPGGELVPVAPRLTLTRSARELILSWAGAYRLLTATNLSETFLPVPAAVSPFTNNLADPERFFRLAPQ